MSRSDLLYKGISASPGIVIGKAVVRRNNELQFSPFLSDSQTVESEIQRFLTGRSVAREQLQKIHEIACRNLGEENAEIFEGHIEILMDDDSADEIIQLITNRKMTAENSVSIITEQNASEIEKLENSYMKERAADIRDIGKRLIYAIAGKDIPVFDNTGEKSIVFAHDLTPSDTAQMDRSKIVGFVTELGGVTSHVAIMAQTLEIPAIVGCSDILSVVEYGDSVVLDGSMGKIVINPSEEILDRYEEKIRLFELNQKELNKLRDLPAVTLDGHKVDLCANISSTKDFDSVIKYGADGIGLFRTEFLYMDRPDFPGEEIQFEAYKAAAELMKDKGVIIRTIDIGGDKNLCYLKFPKEENPFLGWRAIRMCFDTPDILRIQLRSILRASHYGKLRIMYPMIISVSEIRTLNKILEGVKDELRQEKLPFDENIEIGIMIETPAAAIIAQRLAKEVDFFSIGTNDLTQYTLAVDRGNEKIAHLYQPLHPAILYLIKNVIDAAHAEGKWVGMCGELAGNERAVFVLMGLGLDEFSMSPSNISKIKNIIRNSNYSELKMSACRIMEMGMTSEIIYHLDEELLKLKNRG